MCVVSRNKAVGNEEAFMYGEDAAARSQYLLQGIRAHGS